MVHHIHNEHNTTIKCDQNLTQTEEAFLSIYFRKKHCNNNKKAEIEPIRFILAKKTVHSE